MTFQYKLISNSDPVAFTQSVADAVKEGWELQGGVSIAAYKMSDGTVVLVAAQALVKIDE